MLPPRMGLKFKFRREFWLGGRRLPGIFLVGAVFDEPFIVACPSDAMLDGNVLSLSLFDFGLVCVIPGYPFRSGIVMEK